jgi:uncharacterized SAM-binding protein YcdF (DUF218 family)
MQVSRDLVLKTLRKLFLQIGLFSVGITGGVLALAYFFAGEIYDYRDTVEGVRLPPVDAIVCLAGGRGRITAAGDLWYRYWEDAHRSGEIGRKKVPALYFSGLGPQANWSVLSKQLRRNVLQAIRQSDVIIENESSNTDTNARWLARYAQERHWNRILLMTSSYHMKRARLIFDHVLKTQENPIHMDTLSVYQEPFGYEEWRTGPNGIRVTLIEYLKWIYYKSIWRSL